MIELNGVPYSKGKFPNGERVYDKPLVGIENIIYFKWESDQDLMDLLILKSFINEHTPSNQTELRIAYMPYSRMDRGSSIYIFSLKYVCKLINGMNFSSVRILEPHSDVTCALLDRSRAIRGSLEIFERSTKSGYLTFDVSRDVICYPDASAEKRYYVPGIATVSCSKHRDFKSGKISGMSLNSNGVDLFQKTVVILDDMSSRGGTFQGAAKLLMEAGASKVILVVAHAEKVLLEGLKDLSNRLSAVYTTNSIMDYKDLSNTDKVVMYNYKEFI